MGMDKYLWFQNVGLNSTSGKYLWFQNVGLNSILDQCNVMGHICRVLKIFFQDNTYFQTILLVSTFSKLFTKLTFLVQ